MSVHFTKQVEDWFKASTQGKSLMITYNEDGDFIEINKQTIINLISTKFYQKYKKRMKHEQKETK